MTNRNLDLFSVASSHARPAVKLPVRACAARPPSP